MRDVEGVVEEGVRPVASQCRREARESAKGASRSSIMSMAEGVEGGHVGVMSWGGFSMSGEWVSISVVDGVWVKEEGIWGDVQPGCICAPGAWILRSAPSP